MDAHGPVVLPALLRCDFGHLDAEVRRLEAAGAVGLHLDVMDGRFVPHITYGPVVVEAIRRAARVPIEVHLMVAEPDRLVADFIRLGIDVLTVHVEALADARPVLAAITAAGARAHVALNPGTPVDRVVPLLEACDGVLVMAVEPGSGGQPFNPVALEKLAHLAALRAARGGVFRLGVDGGIALDSVGPAARAGAELIVAGTAVLRSADYRQAIASLEATARAAA